MVNVVNRMEDKNNKSLNFIFSVKKNFSQTSFKQVIHFFAKDSKYSQKLW
jgi:hypothetical protein